MKDNRLWVWLWVWLWLCWPVACDPESSLAFISTACIFSCVFWRTSSCTLSVALETLSSFHKCVLAVQISLRFPPIRSFICKHTSACPSAQSVSLFFLLCCTILKPTREFCLIIQQLCGACRPRICGNMKLMYFCKMNFTLWKSVLAPLNPAQTNTLHKTTEAESRRWESPVISPLSLSSLRGGSSSPF